MLERYTTPEMQTLWSEENKFKIWQKVEIAVCKAWNQKGQISNENLKQIENSVPVDPLRVVEIDNKVHHDVIAFLTAWNEQDILKEAGRFIHLGLTSSDLIDTALSLLLKETGNLLLTELAELMSIVKGLVLKHKYTLCIGRTHGVHGEATSFGLKMANFYYDLKGCQQRLEWAIKQISVGMFSGPVGTYSNLTPEIEEIACKILNLKPASISTQVISRDRHADFIYALAGLGSIIEKIATELRHLQRTEVLEVEEPFYTGQKGSSSMPHKRNPWRSENLCGLARILRSYLIPALENITLWHERDISHSSTERIYFPDSANLAHFCLKRLKGILKDLQVYPENMQKNLNAFGGIIHSQKVLLALINKGLTREQAYEIVQSCAMQAWNKETGNFYNLICENETIKKLIKPDDLKDLFDTQKDLKFIDHTLKNLGLE